MPPLGANDLDSLDRQSTVHASHRVEVVVLGHHRQPLLDGRRRVSASRTLGRRPAPRQSWTKAANAVMVASTIGTGSEARAVLRVLARRARVSPSSADNTPSSSSPRVTTDTAISWGNAARGRACSCAMKIEVSSSPRVTARRSSAPQAVASLRSVQGQLDPPRAAGASTLPIPIGVDAGGGRCRRSAPRGS